MAGSYQSAGSSVNHSTAPSRSRTARIALTRAPTLSAGGPSRITRSGDPVKARIRSALARSGCGRLPRQHRGQSGQAEAGGQPVRLVPDLAIGARGMVKLGQQDIVDQAQIRDPRAAPEAVPDPPAQGVGMVGLQPPPVAAEHADGSLARVASARRRHRRSPAHVPHRPDRSGPDRRPQLRSTDKPSIRTAAANSRTGGWSIVYTIMLSSPFTTRVSSSARKNPAGSRVVAASSRLALAPAP